MNLDRRLSFLFICCLALVAGTRGVEVGTDTSSYYRIYDLISTSESWLRVSYYEPFYVFINELVWYLNGDAKHLIFLSVIITIYPTYFAFKKFSINPFLSILLYTCVFGYLTLFNGVRQAIAVAFFIWFVCFSYEKKLIKAIGFAILAIGFHYTAVIGVLAFLIFKRLKPVFVALLYLLSLPFLFSPNFSAFFFDFLFSLVTSVLPSKFTSYASGIGVVSSIGLKDFINQILFVLAFYFYFIHKDTAKRLAKYVLLCTMLSTLLFNYFYYVKYLDRLALYFFIFNAVSIPLFINYMKGANVRLLLSIAVAAMALLLLTRSIVNGSNGITPYSSWLFPGFF